SSQEFIFFIKGSLMKIWIPIAGLLLVAVGVCVVMAQSSAPKVNNVREFMRAKLEHSQKVLEGLATEDFDLIAKNAQSMSLLSQATNWQVLQTPEYSRQSKDFQHSAEALRDAAKK